MKNYGVYCSGGASRILKFYEKYQYDQFPLKFIIYDGPHDEVLNELRKINFDIEVLHFKNSNSSAKTSVSNISDAILNVAQKHNVEYIFCFGSKILSGSLIDLYKNKIINFHPSLLPAFPGINSIDRALKTSVQILGNTAHFIDEGVDTGPIIMQTVIARNCYNKFEDVLSLQLQMMEQIRGVLDRDELIIDKQVVSIKNNNCKSILFTYE